MFGRPWLVIDRFDFFMAFDFFIMEVAMDPAQEFDQAEEQAAQQEADSNETPQIERQIGDNLDVIA